MKIWYFQIIEELYDYIYMMEEGVEKAFGITKVFLQFHQPADHEFYFIGTENEFKKILSILDDKELKLFYEEYEKAYSVSDCTLDVLYDIEKYIKIENLIAEEHVLFNFYKNNISKDLVLDKINELGVESLNEWDQRVLEDKLSML